MPEKENNDVLDNSISEKTSTVETVQENNNIDNTPSYNFNASSNGKKKNIVPIIAIVAIVLVILIGGIGYFNISSNPTNILKKAINNAYKDFSDELKKFDKKTNDFNILEDSMKISGDLELSGDLLKDLKDDKLEYVIGLDYKNKKAEVQGNIKEDGKDLVDAKVYLKDNKVYLASKSLVDKTYNAGEYKFDELFDLSDLEDALKDYEVPSTEDIDFIVKEFKDALIKSLDKEQMTKSKETIEINDLSVKTTKITYNIDKDSAKDLLGSMADILLENDKVIEKLASLTNTDKDDVKDAFKTLKDKDTYEDFGKGGEFSVYTTGLTNKVVKIELTASGTTISYSDHKDNAYILISDKDSDMKIEVTSVKEDDIYNVTVKMNKEKIATLKVRQFDEDGIDFDYDIDVEDVKVSGTIKLTCKEVNKNEYEGLIEFSVNADIEGEKIDVGAKLNYNVKFKEEIADIDTSSAVDINDISEEETTKLMNKVSELENSKLFKFISNLDEVDDLFSGFEETKTENSVTINGSEEMYDDTECYDEYYSAVYEDETWDGTYSEYYNQYCAN